MQTRLHLLVIAASLLLFLIILELIRRGRLREEYSLIWLFSAALIFVISVFRGSLRYIADLVQIDYAPSFIFMVAIGLLIVILVFHSIAISKTNNETRDLAQNVAILDLQLKQISNRIIQHRSIDVSIDYLRDLGTELRKYRYFPDLLKRILELSTESTGASSGSLLLLDDNEKPVHSVGIYNGEINSQNLMEKEEILEKGLAGWVLENRRAALVYNTREDSRWLKRPWNEGNNGSRSAICVLLEVDDHTVGMLTLVHHRVRHFTEHDLAFLMAICTVISHTGADRFMNPHLHLREDFDVQQNEEYRE